MSAAREYSAKSLEIRKAHNKLQALKQKRRLINSGETPLGLDNYMLRKLKLATFNNSPENTARKIRETTIQTLTHNQRTRLYTQLGISNQQINQLQRNLARLTNLPARATYKPKLPGVNENQ